MTIDPIPAIIAYTSVVAWLVGISFIAKQNNTALAILITKQQADIDVVVAKRTELYMLLRGDIDVLRRDLETQKEKVNDLSKELNQKLSDIREILGRMEERGSR